MRPFSFRRARSAAVLLSNAPKSTSPSGVEGVPGYRVTGGTSQQLHLWPTVDPMDIRNDIREFLTTRRARLTPADVGLPDFGGRRRGAGLRREEVALVAGMSVEYYIRLERGNATGVSEAVLDGIARALQLDDAELNHLHDLVRAANDGATPSRRRPRRRTHTLRPGMQQLLDAMHDVPAVVQNGRLDVIGINALGRALFAEMFEDHRTPANFARSLFLDPRAPRFYRHWDDSAQQIVALLRSEAGR